MSHVSQCTTVYMNLTDMEAAAKRLNGELIRGQKNFKWYGSFVDDSKEWKRMFPAAMVKLIEKMSREDRKAAITEKMSGCDHAIRFKQGTSKGYEVGVWTEPDGTYRLRWDGFDSGLNRIMGGYDGGHFAQAYGIEAAKRAAMKQGWKTIEKPRADRKIELEVLVR